MNKLLECCDGQRAHRKKREKKNRKSLVVYFIQILLPFAATLQARSWKNNYSLTVLKVFSRG